MKTSRLIIFLVILAVIFSALAIKINFFQKEFNNKIFSGFATTDTSKINITIETGLIINFSIDFIDWGTGKVNAGSNNATLTTSGSNYSTKQIGGNWTGAYTNNTNGLILQNIGNLNATLYLKTGKNASDFIGGSNGEGPLYQFNVTNNKTGSCINASGFALGVFYDTNSSVIGDGTKVCDTFAYDNLKNSVKIDVLLRIPSDSRSGLVEDTITATAYNS